MMQLTPDPAVPSWYVRPAQPLPSARHCLIAARCLARRPPFCALVGAAFQRVLVQTLAAWSWAPPAAARRTRSARMHSPQ